MYIIKVDWVSTRRLKCSLAQQEPCNSLIGYVIIERSHPAVFYRPVDHFHYFLTRDAGAGRDASQAECLLFKFEDGYFLCDGVRPGGIIERLYEGWSGLWQRLVNFFHSLVNKIITLVDFIGRIPSLPCVDLGFTFDTVFLHDFSIRQLTAQFVFHHCPFHFT